VNLVVVADVVLKTFVQLKTVIGWIQVKRNRISKTYRIVRSRHDPGLFPCAPSRSEFPVLPGTGSRWRWYIGSPGPSSGFPVYPVPAQLFLFCFVPVHRRFNVVQHHLGIRDLDIVLVEHGLDFSHNITSD
jgi:hypothetical protein